jgi:ADP-heptose:LPS heptosyltransferase
MLKKLFKYFIDRYKHKESRLDAEDIAVAEKLFFAVFSRYGDGIISFKIIKELTELYPAKSYLLFTTNQLVPYAKEIMGECVKVVGVNKRNPLALSVALIKLKKFNADLGFNPWSHGDDAEFFISFAKKYSVFKRFKQWGKTENLYLRVREYLFLRLMPIGQTSIELPKNVQNIILVPYSTDVTKSLDDESLKISIEKLSAMYDSAHITVCGTKKEISNIKGVKKFYFSKSALSSSKFLNLLKQSDLFVGVDAGPLHIAMAINIPSVGIFGPTAPETILNNGQNVFVMRSEELKNVFCYVKSCTKPICIFTAVRLFQLSSVSHECFEENKICKVAI